MKPLFWLAVLGLGSLVVPAPRTDGGGVEIGSVSWGEETQKLSPIASAMMIPGRAGLMVAGRARAK